MSDKTLKIIEEIVSDLNDDTRHFQQDFIAFRPKEFLAIRNVEKAAQEKLGVLGKGRIVALACEFLKRSLENTKEEKSNGKT
jgi:hypothetical protein